MDVAPSQAIALFRQNHDAAAFRRFIRKGSQLGRIGNRRVLHSLGWNKCRGLPVPQRDGACFVEEQHVHIPRRFDGFPRHGNHVRLDHAIHARDADGG